MLPLNGDKRRHRRLKSIIPFAYRLPLGSLGIQIGITANISGSAMCIYSDCNHNAGDIIEIRSSLPAAYFEGSGKMGQERYSRSLQVGANVY